MTPKLKSACKAKYWAFGMKSGRITRKSTAAARGSVSPHIVAAHKRSLTYGAGDNHYEEGGGCREEHVLEAVHLHVHHR
eukprot:677783-Rhodomonas_salina.1